MSTRNQNGILEYWKSILGIVIAMATIFGFLGRYIWEIPLEDKNNIVVIKEAIVNLKESSEKNYNAQSLSIENIKLLQDRTNLTLEKFMTSVNIQLENQEKKLEKLEKRIDINESELLDLKLQLVKEK